MIEASLIQSLKEILSPDRVLTSAEDIVPYSFDGTAALKQRPGAVVFPLTAEEVSECVKLARRNNVPVVTRGSGTGLSGGSVPLDGCLVICLVKMDKLIEVDEKNLTLRAQSGVITKEIDDACAKVGLVLSAGPRFDENLHHRRQRG
jgi:glycolate oxidase